MLPNGRCQVPEVKVDCWGAAGGWRIIGVVFLVLMSLFLAFIYLLPRQLARSKAFRPEIGNIASDHISCLTSIIFHYLMQRIVL